MWGRFKTAEKPAWVISRPEEGCPAGFTIPRHVAPFLTRADWFAEQVTESEGLHCSLTCRSDPSTHLFSCSDRVCLMYARIF